MEKEVHVNAYTKKDGTQVREHFRTIDSDNKASEDNSYMDKSPLLKGGVSYTENEKENLKNVLKTGLKILSVASKMSATANNQSVKNLKPQLIEQINQADYDLVQMKKALDKSVSNLVNSKDQEEYTKKYEPILKKYDEYKKTEVFVNRLKAFANHDDFKNVVKEIENFNKNIQNQEIISDLLNYDEKYYSENYTQKMTISEKVVNVITKAASEIMPVGGENLQNAMQDFKKAKENEHAHLLYSRRAITNKELLNLMDRIKIPEDSRGVVYDNNSVQSKQLWKSPEIQSFLKTNSKDLISGNMKKYYDIEFKPLGNFTGHRIDNHLGLQHCKLYNPQITSNGYFFTIILDYYDFEHRKSKNYNNICYNYINNWGYSMQEKNFLENYFIIYVIHEKI